MTQATDPAVRATASTHAAPTRLPPPPAVPPDLTAPTRAFRFHAWIAGLALVAFAGVYLALTFWLGALIYHFMLSGIHGSLFIGILQSLAPALLLLVLLRGLFAIKRGFDRTTLIELQPADEPELFAFLHEIADRLRAPRPRHVFLAPEVNAAVFYDLGFVNFLFPTRKNLMIGLGLLNVLTLSELSAVLAHEFGHFAQKSMTVGRWVYTAEQVAAHVVTSRSWVDRGLRALSVQDVRVAWVGWVGRLAVWTVRAVLDTAYLLVGLSKRALSREMELQADLMAVSITGSDALVHALRKSHAADGAFGSAVVTLQKQLGAGSRVPDVYALQTRFIESNRRVSDDPTIGAVPPLPETETGRAEHRVFERMFAQPPKMWATHPPDRQREDNAKRVYVSCPLDDRSAWMLLKDPEATRRAVTDKLVDSVLNPPAPKKKKGAPVPPVSVPKSLTPMTPEAALAAVDARFARALFHPEYRGVYLGRPLARSVADASQLLDSNAKTPWGDEPIPPVSELYPVQMRTEIAHWKQLCGDHAMLSLLLEGRWTASEAEMNYRGVPVRRGELPTLVKDVEREKSSAADTVANRDRAIRTLHQRIARKVGQGWDPYHTSLLRLVHYAEHASGDVADARGHMLNTFQVVTADGNVSTNEAERLLSASHVAYTAVSRVFKEKAQVVLPPAMVARLRRSSSSTGKAPPETWDAMLGNLALPPPQRQTLGQWLQVADTWLRSIPIDLEILADAALDELLEVEAKLRGPHDALGAAPPPAATPPGYATLTPGSERERQRKLHLWDRFQLADGFWPGLARAAVATALLAGMMYLGRLASDHTVYVYNGLGVPVRVSLGSTTTTVEPDHSQKLDVDAGGYVHVRTVTTSGVPVEEFEAEMPEIQGAYVYDVARAALLYRLTLAFSVDDDVQAENEAAQPEIIGNPRWGSDHSWHRFDEPQRQVTLDRGQRRTTRQFLSAVAPTVTPLNIVERMQAYEDRSELMRAHLRFDPPSARLNEWATVATGRLIDAEAIVQERAEASPSLPIMRLELLVASPDEQEGVCERQHRWAEQHPGGAGAYVTARCIRDRDEQERAFREALVRYPSDPATPFLALAVAGTDLDHGAWSEAAHHVDNVLDDPATREAGAMLGARAARVQWALESLDAHGEQPESVTNAPVARFAGVSGLLAETLGLENGRGEGNAWVSQLALGNLDAALAEASGDDTSDVVVLVGASDGATPDQIHSALTTTTFARRTFAPVWRAALSVRESGEVPVEMVSAARAVDGRASAVIQWLTELRAQPSGHARGDVPSGFNQPMAMAMATIALGGDVPDRWRTIARAYYFASERPYFRPRGPVRTDASETPARNGR